MPFEPGHSKIPGSGRPRGSGSKLAARVMEVEGVSPLEALFRIWKNRRLPFPVRYDALKATLPYCYPRLSAVAAHVESRAAVSVEHILQDPELAKLAETLALRMAEAGTAPAALPAPSAEVIEAEIIE